MEGGKFFFGLLQLRCENFSHNTTGNRGGVFHCPESLFLIVPEERVRNESEIHCYQFYSTPNLSPQRPRNPPPHISTRIYGGISGDHSRGNFLIVSPWKCRRNREEFSMRIFPPPFPSESLRIFPHRNIPRISLSRL